MGKRYLYGDASLIEVLLPQFELMETAEGGYAAVYKDPLTNSFWLKYYATAAAQGGGYLTLMRLPGPGTEKLIDIAISTIFEDESVAAVLRLLDEEAIEKKEFRLELISRLEQAVEKANIAAERVMKIIKFANLADPMNKREVVGKTAVQVKADSDYFKDIAERAKQLLERSA
jgi:ribosomal protein L20